MPTFAQHFRIEKDQAQLDFVDINPERDLPLFLDPYAYGVINSPWAELCNASLTSFFQAALDAIQTGDDARGRSLFDRLSEPHETCLGVSSGRPAGRGVSGKQATDLYDRMKRTRAARTGLLSELSECELFVDGIGPDKISDICTNILRVHLIEYTQDQCRLHGIELSGTYPSGWLWEPDERRWYQTYVRLPVIEQKRLILVPKADVRWRMSFSSQEYYNKFVLEYLQAEHLRQRTALVEVLKNGKRRVTKKKLEEIHPMAKHFLADFSEDHPEVLERYKKMLGVPRAITNAELIDNFDEKLFAEALWDKLAGIAPGSEAATGYHKTMVGILEFIFYPSLTNPKKEQEIHDGRKRIDIVYTNSADGGFFFRRLRDARTTSSWVMIECKNYTREMANPELDQIAGRFSRERGRFGFVTGRTFDNRDRFIARCRDTARDGRGFVVALADEDIRQILSLIANRRRTDIDAYLDRRFNELLG